MVGPPDRVAVAPVLGGAVHALAAVLPQEVAEPSSARSRRRCSRPSTSVKSSPARPGPPVALLEPDHRTVELALGRPLRALDPHAPGQLVERDQRWKAAKPASPPWRPDVGPPAQMRGGSKVKAPRRRRCSRPRRPPRPRERPGRRAASGHRRPERGVLVRRSARQASGKRSVARSPIADTAVRLEWSLAQVLKAQPSQ